MSQMSQNMDMGDVNDFSPQDFDGGQTGGVGYGDTGSQIYGQRGAAFAAQDQGRNAAPDANAMPAGQADYGQYQLAVPEELTLDEQALGLVSNEMKSMGLNNEQANAVLAMAAKNQQAAMSQYAKQVDRWGMETRADPEMGGPRFETTAQYALSALRSFDERGVVLELLEQSGYANHPEVIRFLSRAGKALGEDVAVTGRGHGRETPLHERLYGATSN